MTLPGGFIAGQLLQDRYELRYFLASGGTSMVYRGWDTVLERDVALKRVTFTGQSSEEEADNRARTLREARISADLGAHPHIISIYDRQEIDRDVWLVMEYFESLSLAQIITDATRIDISEAARVGAAVADALAHAHARGIAHCDVKPANILLSPDRRQVKLADFGLAHRDHDPGLTATNVVAGNAAYMPREVARGDTSGDPRADIYSLGATLYEIVEGDTPHGRDTNANRLLIRAAHEPPRPPQHAGPFGPLLQQMLAPEPTTRPTADGARRLLADFTKRPGDPTSAPTAVTSSGHILSPLAHRRSLAAVGLLFAIVIVAAAIFVISKNGTRTESASNPQSGTAQSTTAQTLTGQTFAVGGKKFDEQLILCKMSIALLRARGATVTDRCGLKGSPEARQSLLSGQTDLQWEYTGTGWVVNLRRTPPIQDAQRQYEAVRDADSTNGLTWLQPSSSNNTFGIAARTETLDRLGLRTVSDLTKLINSGSSEATLCAEPEFAVRSDGLPGLMNAYGIVRRPVTTELKTSAVFKAVGSGNPCAFGEVFTTDGRLRGLGLRTLIDDRAFFPYYNPSPVIRTDVLDRHPELRDIFENVSRRLSQDTMLDLNSQVSSYGRDPDAVATSWLRAQGLL